MARDSLPVTPKHVDKELGAQVHQELLVQVNRQDGGAGTVGAHGQQLIKTTVAVHQVAAEENDNTLNAVSLAQELGLLSQKRQTLSSYLEVEPIGWQVDELVEVVVRQVDDKSSSARVKEVQFGEDNQRATVLLKFSMRLHCRRRQRFRCGHAHGMLYP